MNSLEKEKIIVTEEDFKVKQKLLQDELEKYKNSKKSYKQYMQFMDDISAWLQKVAK